MGRMVTPANAFARQFDADFGTKRQQLDLILFLDGQEAAQHTVESDVKRFRTSWRRPKWHIMVQKQSIQGDGKD